MITIKPVKDTNAVLMAARFTARGIENCNLGQRQSDTHTNDAIDRSMLTIRVGTQNRRRATTRTIASARERVRTDGYERGKEIPDGWSQEANLRSELDSEMATESSLGRESVTAAAAAAAADFALPFSMKMDGGDDAREREIEHHYFYAFPS
ncbi:hypothetical protein EUGRSUZ_F00810 [Eucalyptus grandis]|uniref:Uncharacterized protein n=2 Tax=Eucalyptus grandis TaxID=71139 RepID=A0ACC3KDJ0_EUCGR|nr:hypothetical protein EUGRSUZ_F00810 [Eucalyptus grandis]